mmetsp:Transcript_35108/g.79170  ORF Transcript_35108/g.79170 Transcript_35108/m.79170 type:complete len:639 (+) Transcript_35108:61-1977(+)
MSTKVRVVPPLPQTERGVTCHFGCDAAGTSVLYCNGSNVLWRQLEPLLAGGAQEKPEDIFCWRGHVKRVTCVAISPNGQWVASGDETGAVRLWGAKGEHAQKNEYRLWSGMVKDIGWSGDSGRLVAAGDGKEVRACALIWDTGSKTGEVGGHAKQVNSISFRSQRPFRVITGGEDMQVAMHEGPPFKFSKSHTKHTNFVNCVRYSPDGEWSASVGSDSKVCLYSGKDGEFVKEFEKPAGITGSLWSAAWSPDSKRIATAGGDKRVRVWDVASGAQVGEAQAGEGAVEDMLLGVSWPAPGSIMTICLSGKMLMWAVADDGSVKVAAEVDGTQGPLTCICRDGKSGTLVQGSSDGTLALVAEAAGSRSVKIGKGVIHVVGHSAAFSGSSEVWVVSRDDSMRRVSLETASIIGKPVEVKEFMVGVAWFDDAETKLICATGKNSLVCLTAEGVAWSKPGALARRPTALACRPGSPGMLAVSMERPEGLTGGIASNQFDVLLYKYSSTGSADALEQPVVLSGSHLQDISALRFSPSGEFLASADAGNKIFIWNLAADPVKVKIDSWAFHTSRIASLEWLPGANRLVSGSLDQHLFVWDCDAPETRVKIADVHRGGVTAIAACDATSFASVGADGFMVVHKLEK